MEKSILSNSLIQIQSIGNLIQDIWLSALIVSLFSLQTSMSAPFLWVGILILILISVSLLFHKTGYQIALSVGVSVILGLTVFVFNGPFWFFALIVIFSIWRIQERFAKLQEDSTNEGVFFISLVLLFIMSAFYASIFKEEALPFIYILTISGISVFVLERLTVQWLFTKHVNKMNFYKVGFVYLSILSVAGTVLFLISNYAHWARIQIVNIFGDVLMVVLYPIGWLIDNLRDFVYMNIRTPEDKKAVKQPETVEQDTVEQSELVTVSSDIPWTIIIIIISSLLLLFVIWLISKYKREDLETTDNLGTSFDREPISDVETIRSKEEDWAYSMETSKVREAYREFEKEANLTGYTRKKEETIREWFRRQNWVVADRFYTVYDIVRYSQGKMDAEDGEWFILELTLLSKKYLQDEV